MNPYFELKSTKGEIEKKLGYAFNDENLLFLAFVHRSFVNENRNIIALHNERLEFLGDGVLNLVISEYLYKKFTSASEGKLSFFRSQIVDSASCTSYVKKLEIEDYVLLGKGEKQTKDRGRDSIQADLFEALVGAIYLDGGFEKAKDFILVNFQKDIEEFLHQPNRNYKAELQSYCQKKYLSFPIYEVIDEVGPEHAKTFTVEARVNEIKLAEGQGFSKKEAEQNAAKKAMDEL